MHDGRTAEVVRIHLFDPVAELLKGSAALARRACVHRFLQLGVDRAIPVSNFVFASHAYLLRNDLSTLSNYGSTIR